ncbi:MAG: hypothetical protein AB1668_02265 [Nanoarchaeota archaeon]
MKALIQKAELKRIDDVWKKHKPQGLGFSDNDAIILTLETKGGEKEDKFTVTFYCRLKGDGTLGHSMTHASEKRQLELRNFINKYISKDKKYNVRENLNKWKGKDVEVEEIDGNLIII